MLLYLAVVAGPVAVLLVSLTGELVSGNWGLVHLALPVGRRLDLLLRSLGYAALVAVGGSVLGALAGIRLHLWQNRAGLYLRYLVLVMAVVPPYVHALSWSALLHALNPFLAQVGLPAFPLHGLWLSWWVQMMALMPFGVGMALLGFELLDPFQVDAARVMRDDYHVFKKIVIPAATPSIAAGSALIFLFTLMDYSVPSLYQVNTYSLEIFAEYSATYQHNRAFALALPLLILAMATAWVFQSAFRSLVVTPVPLERRRFQFAFPTWFSALQTAALVLILFQVAVPLFSLVSVTGTWQNLVRPTLNSTSETGYTLIIATAAALLCLPLALVAARCISLKGALGRVWWFALLLPLALPGPLVGIGLIFMWNRALPVDLYGSLLMPILAGVIRFIPIAALILLARYSRIDPLLLDAAQILQKSRLHTLLFIHLPLLGKALLAAALLVFVLTSGEIAATLMVAPPGQNTLTMKIYQYLHYGETSSVAGLCLVMLLLALVMGMLALHTLFFAKRTGGNA